MAQIVKNLPAIQETWLQSLGQNNPLEEGMATHSSILAWRIPWTEEPGGLQSMWLQSWTGLNRFSMHAQLLYIVVLVSQSCPSLRDPVDCSPPGSSVHGILQARMLEWFAIPFSRGYSQCRDRTWISCIADIRLAGHSKCCCASKQG